MSKNTSLAERKSKFYELNGREADRISEALNDPYRSEWSTREGSSRANSSRNRYTNVLPWDKSRVRLPAKEGGSDYINASYIKLDGETRYIACQGPLPNTAHHFWSMCYSESEKQKTDTVIVMMVTPTTEDNIVKCAQYWPTEKEGSFEMSPKLHTDNLSPSTLSLHYVSESYNGAAGYVLTEMELRSAEKSKRVLHFYYAQWSDSRVPPSVDHLLMLSRDVAAVRNKEKNPLIPIVHCSAGVGRTGTFMVLDHLLNGPKRPENDTDDPIMNITMQLRDSRMMMVQTVYQFAFLYESLASIDSFS